MHPEKKGAWHSPSSFSNANMSIFRSFDLSSNFKFSLPKTSVSGRTSLNTTFYWKELCWLLMEVFMVFHTFLLLTLEGTHSSIVKSWCWECYTASLEGVFKTLVDTLGFGTLQKWRIVSGGVGSQMNMSRWYTLRLSSIQTIKDTDTPKYFNGCRAWLCCSGGWYRWEEMGESVYTSRLPSFRNVFPDWPLPCYSTSAKSALGFIKAKCRQLNSASANSIANRQSWGTPNWSTIFTYNIEKLLLCLLWNYKIYKIEVQVHACLSDASDEVLLRIMIHSNWSYYGSPCPWLLGWHWWCICSRIVEFTTSLIAAVIFNGWLLHSGTSNQLLLNITMAVHHSSCGSYGYGIINLYTRIVDYIENVYNIRVWGIIFKSTNLSDVHD